MGNIPACKCAMSLSLFQENLKSASLELKKETPQYDEVVDFIGSAESEIGKMGNFCDINTRDASFSLALAKERAIERVLKPSIINSLDVAGKVLLSILKDCAELQENAKKKEGDK